MSAGSPDLLLPIVSDFKASAHQYFESLHAALSERKFVEAKGVLHQIKGASGTIGLSQFRDLCAECERAVVAETVPPQLADLPVLLEESITAALAYLNGEPVPDPASLPPGQE